MIQKISSHPDQQTSMIGDFICPLSSFSEIDTLFASYQSSSFKKLSEREKQVQIFKDLCDQIQRAPTPCFLLPAVIAYLHRANQEKLLCKPTVFAHFEFWFNQNVSDEENYRIRAKIAGKYLPREEYQAFFPVGMGKQFKGTHFVVAHKSPDLDTTVGSFWGWVDAFAARVGDGQHLWSLPGGKPDPQAVRLLKQLFGEGVFEQIARPSMVLHLSAIHLVTQKGMVQQKKSDLITDIVHSNERRSVLLVDEEGYYIGDWRSDDVERGHQILALIHACLRWFENNLHAKLISLFSRQSLKKEDIRPFVEEVFHVEITEPAMQFTEPQNACLNRFLEKIMGLEKGIESSFLVFAEALAQLGIHDLQGFYQELQGLTESAIFEEQTGVILERRPLIFHQLEKLFLSLDHALAKIRNYFLRLDVALAIKQHVFGHSPTYVTLHASIDEMKAKIKNYRYLTLVHIEGNGKFFPIGVIHKEDLEKEVLGTVTLRDFCNFDEMQMASYLQVISVVDHHKSAFKTDITPMALIGDVQSSNVLVAEQDFKINDHYSTAGMTKEGVEEQLKALRASPLTKELTVYQKLIQKKSVLDLETDFFVHPHREFSEYISFLYAILDDTDLLNKVTGRDSLCIAELLNRMKTLIAGKEIETVSLKGFSREKGFAKRAAKYLLKNEDLYSIYHKVTSFREEGVEDNIKNAVEKQSLTVFLDTKEQNGCCRVGQTKIFAANYLTFSSQAPFLRRAWVGEAKRIVGARPHMDFHLHMVSTIPGADEVYHDTVGEYQHKDELWFWIPGTKTAFDHLRSFFTAFQNVPGIQSHVLQIQVMGNQNRTELQQILSSNFPQAEVSKGSEDDLGHFILMTIKAGSLNSRKAMITPYLPEHVS